MRWSRRDEVPSRDPQSWREHLASIRPDADLSEADWWGTTWHGTTPAAVGFLIPRGFEAYARVLHPAWLNDEQGTRVRWAQVAAESGTTLHPQAQWWLLARRGSPYDHGGSPGSGWRGMNPCQGSIERPDFEALAAVLERHTTMSAPTFVSFWVGYGSWPTAWHGLPTAQLLPSQSYLFERPLADVPMLSAEAPAVAYALGTRPSSGVWSMSDGTTRLATPDEQFETWAPHQWQSPTAWWPADRAWVTSSDPDLDSTLVGGTRAMVDDLLADDRLEVLPWPVDGSLWADADSVNR